MRRGAVVFLVPALLAVLAAGCGRSEPEPVQAPTRVKIAHIMLEKQEIPEELDVEAARKLVVQRKQRSLMLELEREELKKAMAAEGFECAVPVTLLKQRKTKK